MFKDRKEAALQLANALKQYSNKNVVVLGIPRGGAETAFYIAESLQAELSLLIARKLGYPSNPEYAMGAIAEDGSLYINPRVIPKPAAETIDRVATEQKKEIERRIRQLRNGKPLPNLKDRIVIIADDGIATGSTLFASITCCKKQHPARLIVAAPIASLDLKTKLQELVDEVVILETPRDYYAVSQGYESFPQLTDEAAKSFLEKASLR